MDFVLANWMLIAVALVSGGMLLMPMLTGGGGGGLWGLLLWGLRSAALKAC